MWRDGLFGGLAEVFLSHRDDLIGLSVFLPLLTRRTMSLEEEEDVRGVFGSNGLLLREEILVGGFLS